MNASLVRYALGISAAAAFVACTGQNPATGLPSSASMQSIGRAPSQPAIQNLIVIIQRSRSFDDIFAGFPGANAPTKGLTSKGRYVTLQAEPLDAAACRIGNSTGTYFSIAWHHGQMDGWNLLNRRHPLCPYTRVNNRDKRMYWSLAKQYAVADRAFSSTHFDDVIEQLYLIAGTTQISRDKYILAPASNPPFGCSAPPGTRTSLLVRHKIRRFLGPFPCFRQFDTIANLFDNAGISWRYYYDKSDWNPFDSIAYVALGRDRQADLRSPASDVLNDIDEHTLSSVSYVLSPPPDSDVPGSSDGPRWVSSIVKALRQSSYWPHSAILVVWAEEGNGNFYDNAPPPQLDYIGLGFRVPLIAISPYAKPRYVSHTTYEFGSILKFIEQNWNLPPLGGYATDRRANSIADMFQF